MNKKVLIRLAAVCLAICITAGIYTFLVIPAVRNEEKEKYESTLTKTLMSYVSVPVYEGETPLSKGTVMTEAISGLFGELKVPSSCVGEETVTDLESVMGLQISGTLSKGEPLTYGNLEKIGEGREENERLKEVTVKNNVCGKVTEGSYVDIIVSYGNGNYDVLLSKKRVYGISENKSISGGYTLVLGIDETEYGNVERAAKTGSFEVRLYYDADDEKSDVTFGEMKN